MLHDIHTDAITRTFIVVFIVYPNLTSKIFEAFGERTAINVVTAFPRFITAFQCLTRWPALVTACRDLGDGHSVLHTDYGWDCNSSEYTLALVFITILMILFP